MDELSVLRVEDTYVIQVDGGRTWDVRTFLVALELNIAAFGDASAVDLARLEPSWDGLVDFLRGMENINARSYALVITQGRTFWRLNYELAGRVTTHWLEAADVWIKQGVPWYLVFIDDHEPSLPRLSRSNQSSSA
jgi:hypothetical protein